MLTAFFWTINNLSSSLSNNKRLFVLLTTVTVPHNKHELLLATNSYGTNLFICRTCFLKNSKLTNIFIVLALLIIIILRGFFFLSIFLSKISEVLLDAVLERAENDGLLVMEKMCRGWINAQRGRIWIMVRRMLSRAFKCKMRPKYVVNVTRV